MAKLLGISRATFNRMKNESKIPNYMKRAQIIPLSKDLKDGPFPPAGAIRTIAILPATFKLFEQIVQKRLENFVED